MDISSVGYSSTYTDGLTFRSEDNVAPATKANARAAPSPMPSNTATILDPTRTVNDPAAIETARRIADAQFAQMVSYTAIGAGNGTIDTGSLFAITA